MSTAKAANTASRFTPPANCASVNVEAAHSKLVSHFAQVGDGARSALKLNSTPLAQVKKINRQAWASVNMTVLEYQARLNWFYHGVDLSPVAIGLFELSTDIVQELYPRGWPGGAELEVPPIHFGFGKLGRGKIMRHTSVTPSGLRHLLTCDPATMMRMGPRQTVATLTRLLGRVLEIEHGSPSPTSWHWSGTLIGVLGGLGLPTDQEGHTIMSPPGDGAFAVWCRKRGISCIHTPYKGCCATR